MARPLDPPPRQLTHGEYRAAPAPERALHFLCPDWTDPRNVGSVFRLADAVGATGLVLGGQTPLPPHPKIARTARATVRTVSWTHVPDCLEWLDDRRDLYVIGLEPTDRSQSLFTFPLPPRPRPLLLVAGNESAGLSPTLLSRCHATVHLPMYGQNSSMNVTTALAAAAYLLRAREAL